MQRIIRILAAGLSAVAAAATLAADNPASPPPQNVILIGWDGCHRDHVATLLKEGKLPNLKQLIAEGTLVNIDVTSGATDTKAGWTQILTGYKPEVTGVYNNGHYQDVPAGLSVFERLKAHFGSDKFAAVAVIGKKQHCGEINPPSKKPLDAPGDTPAPGKGGGRKAGAKAAAQGAVVEENGRKFLVFGGSPYFTMHKSCDEWIFGLTQDAKVGDKALEMLDKYQHKPFFFFVHFAEVDHSGHKSGEPSKEYNDAIISGDTQLGRLAAKLKDLHLYDKTRIYVTADHGFNVGAKGHPYAPFVFLATNDKSVTRDGTRADIAPTVLDRFGLDLTKFAPPLDGESLLKPATKPVEKAPPTKAGGKGVKQGKGGGKGATP
jgi:arylsulfatase A-like enzyme